MFDVDNSFIEQDQVSQEFIYNFNIGDNVAMTTGLFYFSQDVSYGENRFGALFAAAGGGLKTHSEFEHEVRGVYANAEISLSEQWDIDSRRSKSPGKKKTSKSDSLQALWVVWVLPAADPRTCDFNFMDDEDWSNFTYKAGLQISCQ